MHVNGACHCGQIRFTADLDPEKVVICHCTDCQSLSGTAFRVVAPVREADFDLQSGELRIYVKTAESGNKREQSFCPDCGTPIYATSVGGEDRILGLRLGSVAERDQLPPRQQIWTRSAQHWLPSLPDIPGIETA